MKIRLIPLVMAVSLAAAATVPALAGEQRPVVGRFTALAAPAEPRCGANSLTLGFEISGTAAHLGALTGSGSNCTEFTLTTEAVAVWDGIATLTAADGSTVTTVSEGAQDAPIAGRATFLIEHTITGGTGRFDGAAGAWEISGVIDFTTGQIVGEVAGWLSY
jgi:hypothetical protein